MCGPLIFLHDRFLVSRGFAWVFIAAVIGYGTYTVVSPVPQPAFDTSGPPLSPSLLAVARDWELQNVVNVVSAVRAEYSLPLLARRALRHARTGSYELSRLGLFAISRSTR